MEISLSENPSVIEGLLARLQEITPGEMAAALCTLEFHNKLADFLLENPHLEMDQTQLMFSQGLKLEVQTIYLELARQLRAKHQEAPQLLEVVFDFFADTLRELVLVPNFLSDN